MPYSDEEEVEDSSFMEASDPVVEVEDGYESGEILNMRALDGMESSLGKLFSKCQVCCLLFGAIIHATDKILLY